ncbi:MAG: HNH endonuclease signature motif containing protein [Ilumatobacteraceae bacterium]
MHVEATLDSVYSDVAGVCGHVNAQQARLVRLTERVLSEHVWEESGCRTAAHWLAWQTGTAAATHADLARCALRPVLMAAFDAGELARSDGMAAYTDARCGFARNATVTQLSMVVRRYGFEPDPGDPTPRTPQQRLTHVTSEVSLWVDDDRHRTRQGDVGTGPVPGVRNSDARSPRRPVPRRSPERHLDRRDSSRSRNGRSTPSPSGRGGTGSGSTCTSTAPPIGSATFADNWRVPDALRDLYLCDGNVTPIYVIDGIPVNVGRAQPIVPDRTRRLVEHRDLGCRVPGCTQTRWVQVHHVIHRADHGDTDTWNLICLCPTHHRMHHRNQLGITGNADLPSGTPGAVVFTDARAMYRARRSTPPGGPPPTYRNLATPLGERLDHWAVHFNPPRPVHADTN